MSTTDQVQLIIKKKKVVGGGGHHGGAWKVAYADFVTAMMAFFMLMWLLNATSEEQRQGIADYFNPRAPISDVSAGGESFFSGDTVFVSGKLLGKGRGGATDRQDPMDEAEDIPEETTDDPQARKPAEAPAGAQPDQPDTPAQQPGDPAAVEGSDAFDPSAMSDSALEAAEEEKRVREVERFETAFERLKQSEKGNALLEHLSMQMTPDGLLIELTEIAGEPLFTSGSAEPSDIMRALVSVIAPIIASLQNDVAITGHTDAQRYSASSRYSNWDLSSDRANAARRLLSEYGLPQERVARISGAADRSPLSADIYAPENRRIGITLLREPTNPPRTPETPPEN